MSLFVCHASVNISVCPCVCVYVAEQYVHTISIGAVIILTIRTVS